MRRRKPKQTEMTWRQWLFLVIVGMIVGFLVVVTKM
jgi:uncharacterized membrane-anchored protein YhcB (DUF1043 family)